MQEEWRDIVGYEGLYQVSNFGRVKRLESGVSYVTRWGTASTMKIKNRVLRHGKTKTGYEFVTLYKLGTCKQMYVHRLVAATFIGGAHKGEKEVNHKDGNKHNNSVNNLEWCSKKENNQHSRYVLGNGCFKVRCVETGEIFRSMSEAECVKGIYPGSISDIFRRGRKTAGGFHWERI